jgi:transporter family protein
MPTYILYALISMFFAGLTSVIAKHGMKNVHADLALAIRTSMVFAIIWLNVFAMNHIKQVGALTKKDILFLCASGITTALSWIFYYRAIKMGDVSIVASIDKCSLAITIILSIWILKEPVTPKLMLGAALILAGTFVLLWK